MDLAEVVAASGSRVLAIVGCSKNCGKTLTLNHILQKLPQAGAGYGLLSIGIDGEEYDFWLGIAKPRIQVRPGQLVATADGLLKSGTAKLRILERTGAHTPLGELIVGRVEQEGFVMLAGVRHKSDVRNVIEKMFRWRALRVLIDGSYQRLMAADPEVSDGAILVTGATLGKTVAEVVQRTKAVLQRLLVPQAGDRERKAMEQGRSQGRPVAMDQSGHLRVLGPSFDEPLNGLEGETLLAVPGVVTDRILETAMGRLASNTVVVVEDGTRLFVSPDVLERFHAAGGKVVAVKRVNLVAIAVSPVSIFGTTLPDEELRRGIEAIAPGVPIFLIGNASGP